MFELHQKNTEVDVEWKIRVCTDECFEELGEANRDVASSVQCGLMHGRDTGRSFCRSD